MDLRGKLLFRQNFFRVARANFIAQGIALLAAPILSRLFSPADFGVLALYEAGLGLGLSIATWRFDWSIPNAVHGGSARNLFILGVACLSFTSAFVAIGLFYFPYAWGVPLFKLGNAFYFFFLIALIGAGLNLLFTALHVRHGDLSFVSVSRIAQSLVNTTLSLASGFLTLGGIGLLGASAVSIWVTTVVLGCGSKQFIRRLGWTSMRSIFGTFKMFVAEANRSAAASIVNAISLSSTILIFSMYYPQSEVGKYAFLYKFSAAPISLISSALTQSFWSVASGHVRQQRFQELKKLYLEITGRLFLACIPVVSVCLAAPFFLPELLGEEEWGGAGVMLVAMCPMLVSFLALASMNHLIVFGRPHYQIGSDALRIGAIFFAVLAADLAGLDFFWAVLGASIAYFISNVLLLWIHLRVYQYVQG